MEKIPCQINCSVLLCICDMRAFHIEKNNLLSIAFISLKKVQDMACMKSAVKLRLKGLKASEESSGL